MKNAFPLFLVACLLLPLRADEFPIPFNTEKEDTSPMPAAEAARTAELPSGFRLEVFASEPEVQQPISINFDESGRLWVAECYTYAEQPTRWDLDLRDRILVLEDTDGDGKSDKRTVFWDEGTRLTSVLPGDGGVWALCAPNLLFIPDADGDLVPDSDPRIMLDGFDEANIGHNVVNGLKWGPDGWIYARHGIVTDSVVGPPGTPAEERTRFNCAIWRFHPETMKVEVVCHGGTNSWGTDWDRNGQLFYTNTVIGHLWHAIPGAFYERMFGSHLDPSAYEVIPQTADHFHWDTGAEKWSDIRGGITDTTSSLGGGHAHIGCLIYNSGVWPEEYHGKLFTCNLHGRRLNMEHLERDGVGYTARHGKDFLMMKDPWFRGLDLIPGPDGQVWMNDWSDTGECHDNDGIHRTSGRIYRIVYEGEKAGSPAAPLPAWLTKRASPDFGHDQISELLETEDEAKISMGVRWLAEDFPEAPETLSTLLAIAKDDPPGLVRLELASALQRLPLAERFELARVLVEIEADRDDRQQPLMIWYGVADAVREFPDRGVEFAVHSRLPTVTRLVTRKLFETLQSKPDAANSLLTKAAAEDSPTRSAVLDGMVAALEGLAKATAPESWEAFARSFDSDESEEISKKKQSLSLLFGDGRARDELLDIAKDEDADSSARRAALSSLLRQNDETLLPLLLDWTKDRIVADLAIRALAAYDDKTIPQRLLGLWKNRPAQRVAIVDTLVARPDSVTALLKAVENGRLPRESISPLQARQITNLGDEKLTDRLTTVWGEIHATPEATRAEIEEWKAWLTTERIESGDPIEGKAAFDKVCAACHRLYGEGGQLGPDLTGSDRHNIDYLLGNIVNPNELIPADYRMTIFTLKDGRVLSGVVPEQSEKTLTVQSAAGKEVVPISEIAKRETMPISIMPEGLFKALGKDQVRDLVAYLMTSSASEAIEDR